MPEIKIDEVAGQVTKLLKDALYVGVGFGVMTFQKAQEQHAELTKQVEEQVAARRESLEAQVQALETRIGEIEARIDAVLDQVQDRLPGQVRDVMAQAHETAKGAREQVRDLVRQAA